MFLPYLPFNSAQHVRVAGALLFISSSTSTVVVDVQDDVQFPPAPTSYPQLAITGLHELSEARWLPSSKQEMAIIGPVVRNELFFFVLIFGAAMLLILREWLTPSAPKDAASNDAERRLFESQRRRQRRWMIAASTACLAVILVLTADFIYVRANSAPPSSRTVAPAADIIHVPIAEVQDGNLHVFTVNSGAQDFRFLIVEDDVARATYKNPRQWNSSGSVISSTFGSGLTLSAVSCCSR